MGMHAQMRYIVRKFNLLTLAALAAAGCSSFRGGTAPEEHASAQPDYGEVATLRAINGSAVFGKIRVVNSGDGASVLVSMMNVPPGMFRIAFHQTPNCSSPNGFSAGPPWAPPGKDPRTLIPAQMVNSENRVSATFRLHGVRASGANGVAGHSVVVYYGTQVTDARPDVPNDRMACGVFEPAHRIEF
jgi:Cu/Zn superoxide dismutase